MCTMEGAFSSESGRHMIQPWPHFHWVTKAARENFRIKAVLRYA